MNSKKNLYFFFPYRGVGGVPVLFLRLANYLSFIDLYNIFIIDYEDGYMATNYSRAKNIQLVEYNTNTNIEFRDNDIVVFQSMPLWVMPSNLVFSNNTKLIYWTLHPYNIFGYASSIKKIFKNMFLQNILIWIFRYFIYFYDREAIQKFNEKKSIFFMDEENFEQTKNLLDISLEDAKYLPLVIDDIENIKIGYKPDNKILNCIWVGRIGDFKVHILFYTLKKLNDIVKTTGENINFYIVGTGEYLEYLQEQAKILKDLKVIYIDYIDPKELKETIIDMDIGFAMGTAALDFAKFGLPTVLLDFSYEEIEINYKFDWLYNSKNYTLGKAIDKNLCDHDNKSLETILESLESNYDTISMKTYRYVKNNFDIDINVKKFISLIEDASLTYKDLSKHYFEMNMFHKFIGAKKYYND